MQARMWIAICLAGYLGLYNGYLALWSNSNAEPAHIFPYPADSYSHADQAALRQTVPFKSRRELSQLLEDYLS